LKPAPEYFIMGNETLEETKPLILKESIIYILLTIFAFLIALSIMFIGHKKRFERDENKIHKTRKNLRH